MILLSFVVAVKLSILGNNCNTIGTIAILLLGTLSLLGQYYLFQNWGQYYCNTIFPSPGIFASDLFRKISLDSTIRSDNTSLAI